MNTNVESNVTNVEDSQVGRRGVARTWRLEDGLATVNSMDYSLIHDFPDSNIFCGTFQK